MNKEILIKKAKTAIIAFKIEETVEYVEKALQAGATPLEIIDEGLAKGLMILGAQFEKGEIFLLELISGSEAMRQAMELLHPLLEAQHEVKRIGRVLIGTIEGDMHDLGKNIVASVLQYRPELPRVFLQNGQAQYTLDRDLTNSWQPVFVTL